MAPTAKESLPVEIESEDDTWEDAEEEVKVKYDDTLSLTLEDNAKEDLGEDEMMKAESLAAVRSWLQSQPHLQNCRTDQNFLLRFLRMQKYKVEKSCLVLEKYLTMRCSHPKWFQNLDIQDPLLAELIHKGYIFVLPEKDSEGRRVVFSVARNLDPTRHSNSDAMRAHILTFEALLQEEENQIRGFTYIFDCSGLTLSHLSIWTPQEVGKIFSICEKNLPMRHRDINLLMLPFPMWAVFEFCKTLLSSKIRKRFSVHSCLDKLIAKLGGADILPQEYGGSLTIQDMASQWVGELHERRSSLLNLDTMTVAENYVIEKSKERKSSLWSLFSGPSGCDD